MSKLNLMSTLATTSLLVFALAAPVAAITGTDTSGSGKGAPSEPEPEPEPTPEPEPEPEPAPEPEPTPEPEPDLPSVATDPGDRPVLENPGSKPAVCATPDRHLVSSEGALVGKITNVDCRKDGTVLYHVHLVKPFNSEARNVTFKSHARPRAGKRVRLGLTNMEVKKLIWMHAAH